MSVHIVLADCTRKAVQWRFALKTYGINTLSFIIMRYYKHDLHGAWYGVVGRCTSRAVESRRDVPQAVIN